MCHCSGEIMVFKRILIVFTLGLLPQILFSAPITFNLDGQDLYDCYPYSIMYYYGITGSDPVVRIVKGEFHRWPEHVQAIEVSRTLDKNNFLRRLLKPLVGTVQLAGNVARRNGCKEHVIYEFNPFIAFRWSNFSWNKYINMSLMVCEGVSYDTAVPSLEKRTNVNTKRLLNYLVIEATFAAPRCKRVQLVTRIHHRSGAYGLYHAGNTGSNAIGLGIRYLFN